MSETTPENETSTTVANPVEPLVMRQDSRCENCGYTQQDAEFHGDHHLCKNKNPPWLKYFRSQMVPGNIGTMVYWLEYEDGKSTDVNPSKIPDGAVVSDITFESDKRNIRKSGDTFVAA